MRLDITNPLVLGTIAFVIGILIWLLIQLYKFFTTTNVTEVVDVETPTTELLVEDVVPPPPNPKSFKKK